MLTLADVHMMDTMAAAGWSAAMIVAACRAAIACQSGIVAESRDMSSNVAPAVDARERRRAHDRDYRRRRRGAEKQAIADRQPDLFPVTLAVVNEPPPISATLDDVRARLEDMLGDTGDKSRNASDPPSLKEKFPPAPPSKENNPFPMIDDAEARTVVSMISAEAIKLADQLGAIAGIDPDPMACPPGWCGAAMQVQSWLNAGWPVDAILVGARTAMARKRDGPPTTVAYFTKEIAKAVAQLKRPLPEVSHVDARRFEPKKRPLMAAVDEICEELNRRAEDERRACGPSG